MEMYNVWKDREDRLIGRYCGFTAPGPIESREGAQALKLIFHTDEEGVYSGFKARYIFFTAKSIYGGSHILCPYFFPLDIQNFILVHFNVLSMQIVVETSLRTKAEC